jgi:cytidine deaminase
LAGAVGARLHDVSSELQLALRDYGFDSFEVSLSSALKEMPGAEQLVESPYDDRVWAYMDAGNALRKRWQRGDALALLTVPAIIGNRQSTSAPRIAHILRSVKHPAEVATLRAIYGSRFFLVSVYSPRERRLEALREQIEDSTGSANPADWAYLPSQLLDRDEHETDDYGQQLRDTFPLAEFFVDARDRDRLRPQLTRFIELIFGHPFRTPSRDEYALASAATAALRSAELGRQVGACLTTPEGDIIALGTNEVPKSGGGLYWEGDEPDGREFHLGADTNDERKREIAHDIFGTLSERRMLNTNPNERPEAADVLEAILRSDLGALTEFGRAVHAEMAALLDANRRGAVVLGAKLYATTFPCHNCARHLIAAGVSEVVYVAPYAKSQAFRLHEDAIAVAVADPPPGKVHMRPFVGLAPRAYRAVFEAGARKTRSGEIVEFNKIGSRLVSGRARVPEFLPDQPAYVAREAKANNVLSELLSDTDQSPDSAYEE